MTKTTALWMLFVCGVAFGQQTVDNTYAYRTLPFRQSESERSVCSVGEVYLNTISGKLRFCATANTWADMVSASAGTLAGATDYTTNLVNPLALKANLISPTFTNPSLGIGYLSSTKTAGSGGTTANLLVKIDSTGNVVLPALGDVGLLGIAISTVSNGGLLEVATRGIVSCIADNTTVVGNIALVGTTTAGRCLDSGSASTATISISKNVVGKFLTAATVGQAASVQLYGPGHYGAQILGSDVPTLNQSTSGNAATATTAVSFSGSLAGDVTGTQSAAVVGKINGTALSGLATGILKNTTTSGVPSIAVANTDYLPVASPVFTGNMTGPAEILSANGFVYWTNGAFLGSPGNGQIKQQNTAQTITCVHTVGSAATPNSAVTGSPCDTYVTNAGSGGGAGTTFWVKESGSATNTGWVGK